MKKLILLLFFVFGNLCADTLPYTIKQSAQIGFDSLSPVSRFIQYDENMNCYVSGIYYNVYNSKEHFTFLAKYNKETGEIKCLRDSFSITPLFMKLENDSLFLLTKQLDTVGSKIYEKIKKRKYNLDLDLLSEIESQPQPSVQGVFGDFIINTFICSNGEIKAYYNLSYQNFQKISNFDSELNFVKLDTIYLYPEFDLKNDFVSLLSLVNRNSEFCWGVNRFEFDVTRNIDSMLFFNENDSLIFTYPHITEFKNCIVKNNRNGGIELINLVEEYKIQYVEFDENKNKISDRIFENPYSLTPTSIVANDDFTIINGIVEQNNHPVFKDEMVCIYNNNNELIAYELRATQGHDECADMTMINDNEFYIIDSQSDSLIVSIAKFNSSSVKANNEKPYQFKVNYISKEIIISLPAESEKLQSIEFYDIAGKKVNLIQISASNFQNMYSFSNMNKGLFFARIKTDKAVYSEKILVK